MATRRKGKKAEANLIEIRTIGFQWPNMNASASITIALKPNTPTAEGHALGISILRLLIMQESALAPLPTSISDDAPNGRPSRKGESR